MLVEIGTWSQVFIDPREVHHLFVEYDETQSERLRDKISRKFFFPLAMNLISSNGYSGKPEQIRKEAVLNAIIKCDVLLRRGKYKSDEMENPVAYYTSSITNEFRAAFNDVKASLNRSTNIDLAEANGNITFDGDYAYATKRDKKVSNAIESGCDSYDAWQPLHEDVKLYTLKKQNPKSKKFEDL